MSETPTMDFAWQQLAHWAAVGSIPHAPDPPPPPAPLLELVELDPLEALLVADDVLEAPPAPLLELCAPEVPPAPLLPVVVSPPALHAGSTSAVTARRT